VAKIA
jgi:hypothetical protein